MSLRELQPLAAVVIAAADDAANLGTVGRRPLGVRDTAAFRHSSGPETPAPRLPVSVAVSLSACGVAAGDGWGRVRWTVGHLVSAQLTGVTVWAVRGGE